jgi:tetratricopeptide (TPR) repeat protein
MPIENPLVLIGIGYFDVYMGNNDRGNRIMKFGLNQIEETDYEVLHEISVQNTKNGNYALAFNYLIKAAELNPEVYGYFGWVMLYYYRDYKRALKYLTLYDSLTPDFSDFPMGESLFYLKGLAYMQLEKYDEAIIEFDYYIHETTSKNGIDWVEASTFYYKAISLSKIGKKKEALKCFDQALQINKYFPEVHFQKSFLVRKKMRLQELEQAKKLLEQGYARQDTYIEFFYPVYIQNVECAIFKCSNN